jgi:hypothetical protein
MNFSKKALLAGVASLVVAGAAQAASVTFTYNFANFGPAQSYTLPQQNILGTTLDLTITAGNSAVYNPATINSDNVLVVGTNNPNRGLGVSSGASDVAPTEINAGEFLWFSFNPAAHVPDARFSLFLESADAPAFYDSTGTLLNAMASDQDTSVYVVDFSGPIFGITAASGSFRVASVTVQVDEEVPGQGGSVPLPASVYGGAAALAGLAVAKRIRRK